jgi:hypothetical protein
MCSRYKTASSFRVDCTSYFIIWKISLQSTINIRNREFFILFG